MTSWVRLPLVPVALAFATGIAAAPSIPRHVAWVLMLIGLAWAVSLLVLDRPRPATAFLLIGIAAVGALRAAPQTLAADHVARLTLPASVRVEGRLAAEPLRATNDRTRLTLDVERVDGEARSGRLRLTAYGRELAELTEGQRVEVTARLHHVTGFRNPAGFDDAAHLRREGVLVSGSARAERIEPLDDPDPPGPVTVRRRAREAMASALPLASATLLGGLLLGDRAGLPPEIDDAFRRAGVYHVLAVSGFNVALVAGSAWALLALARVGHRGAAAGAIVAVIGFALVVGPEPSVVRAVIMGVLVLGGLLLDREASVLNSLALAALLILAVRPGDLLDPGFQLSFAATAGIVLAPHPRGLVLSALAVSVAAQLAVLPVALVHFNQLSTIGPLANLAVVPLAAIATILGLLAVTLSFVFEAAAVVLLTAVWPILLALRGVVAIAAAIPGAQLHLPAPPGGAIVAYVLALGLGLLAWHLREAAVRRARLAGAAAAMLLAVALAVALWPILRPSDGRLRLSVLDVGQGDAMVVEAPDGRVMLVDAGPGGPLRLDTGERVVAPFLWNRGILRLAAAVTTHDDQDHAGGMGAIRRRFTIADEWPTASPVRRWIGGVSVQALDGMPRAGVRLGTGRRRGNDDVLVLRLDHGLASFLLVSDLTADAERELLVSGAPLQALVLKVAHHGSRHASTPEFLARVRPAFAVISVGSRNSYGHPSPETLARLAAVGARIYRTDRDGAVLFETDGRVLTVTRWADRAVERYCLDPERSCDGPDAG